MKKPNTLVSIILPVSNSRIYLKECLTSLLLQTYTEIEIIAVDDNSHDKSWNILKTLSKQDKRLKIYKNIKKYGLTVTLNRAVRKAKGAFIGFIRAEDKISAQKIQQQVSFLMNNPKVAAVGTQMTHIGENGKSLDKSQFPTTHEAIYPTLIQQTVGFYFESALINRIILPMDIMKFTNTLYPHMYSDLFLKMTKYGQLANLSQYLYSCRMHVQKERQKQGSLSTKRATVQLWVKSITQYDYRPTLRSLFTQFAK